jgi:hypothetical protein
MCGKSSGLGVVNRDLLGVTMKKVKHLSVLNVLLLLVLSALPAFGQKVWEKKSYDQWSLGDTRTILMDSPWAQTRIEKTDSAQNTLVVRLHSALPVRQALIREKQIELNYHKFTAADKARFDSELKEFLECPDCLKYYMVTLSADALRPLRRLSVDQVKPYIYLANDQGERRALVSFVASGEAKTTFIFKRFDDQGKPLIDVTSKRLYFKIEDKLLESRTVPIARFTFEVSPLIQNGVVIF